MSAMVGVTDQVKELGGTLLLQCKVEPIREEDLNAFNRTRRTSHDYAGYLVEVDHELARLPLASMGR